jgi:signal transduction histidine kinase
MSHEIRTPLNAIVGFTSLLPDITDDAERQGLLDLVNENTQKLLRIVDDVVSISKIESGQEQLVMTTFDLNNLLIEAMSYFASKVNPNVEMKQSFAQESLTITTDMIRLSTIAKHLVSNATKFTTQGIIEVGYDQPQDGRVVIWVRDTGKGIAEADRENIFKFFTKVDDFSEGLGLGLPLTKQHAQNLGGSLTLDPDYHDGCRFILELPL